MGLYFNTGCKLCTKMCHFCPQMRWPTLNHLTSTKPEQNNFALKLKVNKAT